MIGATKRIRVVGVNVFATFRPRRRWFRTGLLIGLLLVAVLVLS